LEGSGSSGGPSRRNFWKPRVVWRVAGVAAVVLAGLMVMQLAPGWIERAGNWAHSVHAAPIAAGQPAFAAVDYGFSIKFPANPVRTDGEADTGDGRVPMVTYQSGPDIAGYRASALDLPCTPANGDLNARLKASLDSSVTAAASSSGSTVSGLVSAQLSVAGHQGLRYGYALVKGKQQVHVTVAAFFDGPRFFVLMATNPPAGAWDTFLGSFQIFSEPGTLPECAPFSGDS
jgi:hypothetical protein